MTRRSLEARLAAIAADAEALARGGAPAAAIDEQALVEAVRSTVSDLEGQEAVALPILARLEQALAPILELVQDDVRSDAEHWRGTTMKWRPDPPPMPRGAAPCVVLDCFRGAQRTCVYRLSKQRYEALRATSDRCDCQARIAAEFLYHRPEGPLTLLHSDGVPYAAMEYVWRCDACGTRWLEDEGHDDMGSHSAWSVARGTD